VPETSGLTTFLFTDIEGSTRLWEEQPERMRAALACHDALARRCVSAHRGDVVKTMGDGIHAAFADPLDAIVAALEFQQALADPAATADIALAVRCGVHAGVVERRDNDFFGAPVNRAARLMGVAHGGQVLLSQAVADLVADRMPPDVSLRDLGAVRLRDLASPEYVFQLVHPRLRHDFPALRSLEATPNNLPQQVTSFVGRERELAEVKALLGTTRLLTLVGAGGLGKSRLSLQVAADVMDAYPDGVFLVELAALADPQLVPQAVASVLGVKEEGGRSVADALARYAATRHALLILDNCEHLLQACAELAAALLQAGSRIKILASSREPLRTTGETTYHLMPLGVPDTRRENTPEALSRYESVRLFLDRACAAQPSFCVTPENSAAVAEICTRLDGIPLALELAAARVRVLSAERIAERLGDRFRLLTGGSRTALPRQQTLRALIDWSYDLLTPPERALLQRLAVFAGGWTLDAAEAVGAGGTIEAADVLEVLTHLVEKSLVAVDAGGERYYLLDTVRHYALERLAETHGADEARARHVGFYLALAEKAKPELHGANEAKWLAQFDADRENLIAAHSRCDALPGGAQLGLRLVDAVQSYWITRGLLGLGYRLTEEALARAGAEKRDLTRCRALFGAGWLGCLMGRYAEARAKLEQSLGIAREIRNTERVAAVLQPLALAALGLGDHAAARAYAEEALGLARQGADRHQIAAALTALAQVCRAQGEYDAVEPLYQSALDLAREVGDREATAINLLNLAMVTIERGAVERSRAMLREVLATAADNLRIGHSALDVCAGLAATCGDGEIATQLYGASEALAVRTGNWRDPADEAFLAPLIAKARGALAPSAFEAAESVGRALSYEEAIGAARNWLSPGR
jgi:predicted ATPase/class 3 adenylate cyclase